MFSLLISFAKYLGELENLHQPTYSWFQWWPTLTSIWSDVEWFQPTNYTILLTASLVTKLVTTAHCNSQTSIYSGRNWRSSTYSLADFKNLLGIDQEPIHMYIYSIYICIHVSKCPETAKWTSRHWSDRTTYITSTFGTPPKGEWCFQKKNTCFILVIFMFFLDSSTHPQSQWCQQPPHLQAPDVGATQGGCGTRHRSGGVGSRAFLGLRCHGQGSEAWRNGLGWWESGQAVEVW